MRPKNTWKNLERKVAKIICGKRIPVSGCGDMKGDVFHKFFFIECKYGKQIPKKIINWYEKARSENTENKITLLILKYRYSHDEFVFLTLKDFLKIYGGGDVDKR